MKQQKRRHYPWGKGVRKKGIKWEYNGDGRYPIERVKGKDKRYWKRWSRRICKGYSEVKKQEILAGFAIEMSKSVNTIPIDIDWDL